MIDIQIRSRIDSLLSQFNDENQSFPKELITQLNANAAESDKTVWWNTIAIMITWFASFGIGVGMIDKGNLGPFSVAKVQDGLIIMPMLIGFFNLGLASSVLQSNIYSEFIQKIYSKLYPKISEHKLDSLLIHPTPILTTERIINNFGVDSRGSKVKRKLWNDILWLLILIPIIAFVHISIIVWGSGTWFWLIKTISIFSGMLFLIRGYYMWALAGSIT